MHIWRFIFLMLPTLAQASEASSISGAGVGSSMLQMIAGLMVVIALILLLAWTAKRLRLTPNANTHGMKVLMTHALGQRERLMLVDVGGKHLLLGVTSHQISCLHVFDEPVDMTRPDNPGFKQILKHWRQPDTAPTPQDSTESRSSLD